MWSLSYSTTHPIHLPIKQYSCIKLLLLIVDFFQYDILCEDIEDQINKTNNALNDYNMISLEHHTLQVQL